MNPFPIRLCNVVFYIVYVLLSLSIWPSHSCFAEHDGTNGSARKERPLSASRVRLQASIGQKHLSDVLATAFSPDDMLIATGDETGRILLWETLTGRSIRSFEGHADKIAGLGFSVDGKWLVSGGYDSTLRIWDVKTGIQKLAIDNDSGRITDLVISPGGRFGLSVDTANTLKWWELPGGKLHKKVETGPAAVNEIALSPDGKFIFAAKDDSVVTVRDFKSGKLVSKFDKHEKSVRTITVSGSGKYAASADADTNVCVWRTGDNAMLQRFALDKGYPYGKRPLQPVFTADEKFLFVGTDNLRWDNAESLYLYDLESGQEVFRQNKLVVLDLLLSHNGRFLLVSSGCNFFNCFSELDLFSVQARKEIFGLGRSASVASWDFAFSPNGSLVLCGNDLWDLKHATKFPAFKNYPDYGLNGSNAVAFSPNGKMVATADGALKSYYGTKSLVLWDPSDRKRIRTIFTSRETAVGTVAFSPDNRYLLSACYGQGGSKLELWEVASGKKCRNFLEMLSENVVAAAFSTNGLAVYSVGDKMIKWDVETGEKLRVFTGNDYGLWSLSIAPDNSLIAGANHDFLYVWNESDGVLKHKIERKGGTDRSIAFSPDGKSILMESGDELHLIDAGSGDVQSSLPSPSGNVKCMKFWRR